MAQDPRVVLNDKNCPKATQNAKNNDAARKGFFRSVRKLGDLEVLNEVGAGDVGKGLRTMAQISDSIRTGDGVLPTAFGDSLANGANAVLAATNIDPVQLNFAKTLNPGVANRALGQAKDIADKVSNGDFKFEDIPTYISDLQAGEQLIRKIFTNKPNDTSKEFERCVSPYATDLISFAPKYKFLFVVEFRFTAAYGALENPNFAFVIKQSTRPTVTFEYDEINMYNFRTKVIKRSTYEPMSMRFYDDTLNSAMGFYDSYLKAMSPISNMKMEQAMEGSGLYEESGMDFGESESGLAFARSRGVPTARYAASIGPLQENAKTVLSRVILHQVYNYGKFFNTYEFYNPRITRLELDDLDMADNGNGNEVSFQFDYDGMHLQTHNIMSDSNNFKDKTKGGIYPLSYNGPTDSSASDNSEETPSADQQQSLIGAQASKISNAFSNAFNQAQKFGGSAVAKASSIFGGPGTA